MIRWWSRCSTTDCTLASIEVTRVSPGVGVDVAVVAEHAAHRVDGDLGGSPAAAQPLVVLLLDAGAPDDRGAVDDWSPASWRGVELVVGDRAEVAQDVGEVDAEGPG